MGLLCLINIALMLFISTSLWLCALCMYAIVRWNCVHTLAIYMSDRRSAVCIRCRRAACDVNWLEMIELFPLACSLNENVHEYIISNNNSNIQSI